MTTMRSQSRDETRPGAGDPTGAPETLVFLCGADMNPTLVRRRAGLERARFVAIARIDGSEAGRVGLPAELGSDAIWGIALTIAADASLPMPRGAAVSTVLRDDTSVEAVVLTDPVTVGSVADVLREAHYWELPVAYRDRLQALLPS